MTTIADILAAREKLLDNAVHPDKGGFYRLVVSGADADRLIGALGEDSTSGSLPDMDLDPGDELVDIVCGDVALIGRYL